MTVTNSTPYGERLVKVFERLLWLAKKAVDRTDVGECHGFATLVTRCSHQTQRFAVLLHRLTPRIARPFALEFGAREVGTLSRDACAIRLRRSPQIIDPNLVSSGRCVFLQRAHIQLISSADVSHEGNHFHASCAAKVVINFKEWFSIRR